MNKLNAVEQFFYDNAGYSYDPAKETQEEGRRKCAVLLASAEQWAHESGYTFSWDYDSYDSSEWIDDDEDGGKNCDPWQTLACCMIDEKGNVVQSLYNIDFGRDGQPWGNPHRRVVEAELASEEWNTVVKF